MNGCAITSRAVLIIISLVFLAATIASLYIGVEIYITYQHFNEVTTSQYVLIPASILIAIGIFMLVLFIISCLSSCKESKCLLACLFMLLLVVFVAEVAAGVLGYMYQDKFEGALRDGIENGVQNYTSPTMKNQVDYIQDNLQCCGVQNYTDWETSAFYTQHNNTFPSSCCHSVNGTTTKVCNLANKGFIYTDGCFQKLEDLLKGNLALIAGVAVAFALIQILGMICSCILLCHSKSEVPYENIQGFSSSGGIRA